MSSSGFDRQALLRAFRLRDAAFELLGLLVMLAAVLVLGALFLQLLLDGLPRLSGGFFLRFASRFPEQAGILAAWVGSLLVLAVTAASAIPVGVGAGIWLEEYAPRHWLTDLVEVNVTNLAGVPSIVYGLLALGLLVQGAGLGESVLAAGLTLGMMILPIVIVATREAIRAVPGALREASYAVGATRWETVRHHVLPNATPGVLTGSIIGLSRAVGETAPLIAIGAVGFIAFLPPAPLQPTAPFVSFDWLHSPFTVLPIQLFNWLSRPDPGFHANAAAAGIVLVMLTLGMNAWAIRLRHRARRRLAESLQ